MTNWIRHASELQYRQLCAVCLVPFAADDTELARSNWLPHGRETHFHYNNNCLCCRRLRRRKSICCPSRTQFTLVIVIPTPVCLIESIKLLTPTRQCYVRFNVLDSILQLDLWPVTPGTTAPPATFMSAMVRYTAVHFLLPAETDPSFQFAVKNKWISVKILFYFSFKQPNTK